MPQHNPRMDTTRQNVAVHVHIVDDEGRKEPMLFHPDDPDTDMLNPASRAILFNKEHPYRLIPDYPDGKRFVQKLRPVIHDYFSSPERRFAHHLAVAPCTRAYIPWDEKEEGTTEVRMPHTAFTLPGSARFDDDDLPLLAAGLWRDFMQDAPKDRDCFVEVSIDPETGVLYNEAAMFLVFNIVMRYALDLPAGNARHE